jgi:hypothetical protein
MNLRDSIERRLLRQRLLSTRPELIPIEIEMCRRDILHWFDWWVWTYDPRRTEGGDISWLPLDLFPRQVELVNWLDERIANREDGLVEKSREIGFTWVVGGYAAHRWLFHPGFKTTFASRVETLVDRANDPDSIFQKIRMLILGLPHWMLPHGFSERKHFNYMRIIHPSHQGIIAGETGDNAGRGGRSSLYVIDEAAFIDRADLIDAATTANTYTRIWGSTVNGPGNLFYRKRFGGTLAPRQIFRFHYSDNPLMTPELIAKMRAKTEPFKWASEYEIDYAASVEGICIPSSWVESAKRIGKLVKIEPAIEGIAGGDVGAGKAKSVLVPRFGPVVGMPKSWGEPDTIETAHRMLDACQAAQMVKSNGVACKVRSLRFDNVGVGQGVEAALAHAQRSFLTTIGVNVGMPPTDMDWPDGETSADKFANLKAEAWWLMRERFKASHEKLLFLEGRDGGQDHPVSELIVLPDDTEGPDATALASQISLVKWTRNEKGRIAIESKDRLARRGIASPDYADALVLTFTGYSAVEVWMQLASNT